MLELYISFLILVVIMTLVYKKFFAKNFVEAEWLVLDKDITIKNNLNWDTSDKTVLRVANFNYWKSKFFGKDLYIKLKENEGVLMDFKSRKNNNYILDVNTRGLESVYHITNPGKIFFTCKKEKGGYLLEKGKDYIFFLRDLVEENQVLTKIYKVKDINYLEHQEKIVDKSQISIDEEDLYSVFVDHCKSIREAMQKRGYYLAEILQSQEYVSYPSNIIAHKLSVESELGDVMFLVCTNKEKTNSIKGHTIEVNSKNNSFNWKPENNDIITHLLIDNSDMDDEFTFYERTLNVHKNSKLLSFGVMVFKK